MKSYFVQLLSVLCFAFAGVILLAASSLFLQIDSEPFDNLSANLSNLHRLSDVQTCFIRTENFTVQSGSSTKADPIWDKGKRNIAEAANAARDFIAGWEVNLFSIRIGMGETFTIADNDAPDGIQHICARNTRRA